METILDVQQKTADLLEKEKVSLFNRVKALLPDAYWPWLFLVLSVGLIAWQTPYINEAITGVRNYADYALNDAVVGWNSGSKKFPVTKKELLSGRSVGGVIVGVFVLGLALCLLAFVSWFHYKFLYKRVLLKKGISYTALYVVWVLVLWRLLIAIDDSENSFSAENVAIATFIIGFSVIYAFYRNSQENKRRQLILVQQRTQAELDALKAQVNPHFLFNSLNSIYGTAIVEDSPRTAESIQQLSGIVRYVMEESRLQTTDVRRELRFIDDYVELQRVRIPNQENIQITTNIEWDEKPAQIMPLLLNPLIENAFKYGISIQYPCFVRIHLRVQDGTLKMTTENSILTRTDLEKGTGIGLANVRQRLELAYPGRHLLTVSETDDAFLVDLTIKL